jgi:hypothetical protein
MAFTFNWAGLNVPVIQGGNRDYQQTIRADAANAGNAVRGYEQKKANWDYAHLLDNYSKGNPRIAEIENEIAQLQAQNAELEKQRAALAG